MGQLAQLAGAEKLKGKVQVNGQDGIAHVYENEEAAEAIWGGQVGRLEHRRGAFYETAASEPRVALVEEYRPRLAKKKRKRRSSDDDASIPES